ncbi:branched-chain amino acid transport system II carrier protein [Brevibacillus dissolubilis]|uniref:branched-chain amino acid transport system II carrier protein n=1 Tax=Brevibacillus dissolubilis TaxID=1844116 RepID=UPI0011175978|nr:branched-chain amino acid transport system II carrier protein [Brevibacillus dissolubilis]
MESQTKKETVLISFMLFSLFFGAGNLIFPPFLGFQAGEHVWVSLLGFILTAVAMPIMGVVVLAKLGDVQSLASRVHPWFSFVFFLLIYLAIGPFLAIPRAGSLAYEVGLSKFLPAELAVSPFSLLLYTVVFFSIVYWLSLQPSKLVSRFGKVLTPLLLILVLIVFIKRIMMPIGELPAAQGNYAASPFFQGFLDGYMTMDGLGSPIIGLVLVSALRLRGITEPKQLMSQTLRAGVGAAILLTSVYFILGFLGATSHISTPIENGAQILSIVADQLFGQAGAIVLGVIFTVACLCVSIGLVISCSQYFFTMFPRLSYQVWVSVFCLVSMMMSNLGLTQILKVSVPILGLLYPATIMLILMGLMDHRLRRYPYIYVSTISLVVIYGLVELALTSLAGENGKALLAVVPLYDVGLGWVIPALVGFISGLLFVPKRPMKTDSSVSTTPSVQ